MNNPKEEALMKLYGGIDLHSNNSVIVVLNKQDQVVYEKKHKNNILEIVSCLLPFRSDLQGLVVESTYNWYWLVDGLMDSGFKVHLANPEKDAHFILPFPRIQKTNNHGAGRN